MFCRKNERPTKIHGGFVRVLPVVVSLLLLASNAAATTENETPLEIAELKNEDASAVRFVVICSRFDEADIQPIERTIFSQLGDLNISIRFHYTADLPDVADAQDDLAKTLMNSHGAQAAFIIYLSEPHTVIRILLDTDNGLEATRRTVDVTSGAPLHESLGIIVRAMAITVVARQKQRKQIERTPPEPSKMPAETLESESKPSLSDTAYRRMNFTVGAAVGYYSAGVSPWAGIDLSLGWRPSRYWHVHIGYVLLAKVEKTSDDVTLALGRNPVRIGVGYARPVKRFVFGGGIAFTVDFVTETISSRSARWRLESEETQIHPAATGFLQMDVEIREPLAFYISLEADIPLRSAEYQIDTSDDGEESFISPLPVQPILRLGLRIHFF